MPFKFSLAAVMFAVVFLVVAPAPAAASTLTFASDGINESNSITGTNVAITVDPSWLLLPPSDDAHWESYANTGYHGTVDAPVAAIPGPPTAWFYETLPTGTTEILTLSVLADDTSSVYLYDSDNPGGLLIKAPDPTEGTHCANQPITCTETWTTTDILVSSGPAMLAFGGYQGVADTPFGIEYAGTVSVTATTPEPGTFGVTGFALCVLGYIGRRRLKKGGDK